MLMLIVVPTAPIGLPRCAPLLTAWLCAGLLILIPRPTDRALISAGLMVMLIVRGLRRL